MPRAAGATAITSLVAPSMTPTAGATYAYDPYGQLTAMTSNVAAGINNPWRYVSA